MKRLRKILSKITAYGQMVTRVGRTNTDASIPEDINFWHCFDSPQSSQLVPLSIKVKHQRLSNLAITILMEKQDPRRRITFKITGFGYTITQKRWQTKRELDKFQIL